MGNEVRNDILMKPFSRTLTPEEAAARKKEKPKAVKYSPDWFEKTIKQTDNSKKPIQMMPFIQELTPEEVQNRKKLNDFIKKHNVDNQLKNIFKK